MRYERNEVGIPSGSTNYDRLEVERNKWIPKGLVLIVTSLASLDALITTAKWLSNPTSIPVLNADFYISAGAFVFSVVAAKSVFSSDNFPVENSVLRVRRWVDEAKKEGYTFPIGPEADNIIVCRYLDSRDKVGQKLHILLDESNSEKS